MIHRSGGSVMAAENRSVAGVDQSGMTRTQIEALFARRQDDYDNLDAASLAADYADDAVIESPLSGRHGKAEAQHGIEAVFRAFLDFSVTTEALLIDGHRVAQVATIEGTNFGGLDADASGKSFKVPAVLVYELRNGKIAHEQRVYDLTGALVQAGILKAKPV
jgi:predicted ester cyclase